jgi:hypothetical protein
LDPIVRQSAFAVRKKNMHLHSRSRHTTPPRSPATAISCRPDIGREIGFRNDCEEKPLAEFCPFFEEILKKG